MTHPAGSAPATPAIDTRTVLVADADRHIRRAASLFLHRLGYQVLEARNGREALELVGQLHPFLVIADVAMPELGGVRLLQEIKAHHADLDVVLVSGHADTRSTIDAIKAGARDFVKKPFLLDELRVAVERVREHHELKQQATELKLLQERTALSRTHLLQMMMGLANIIDAKSQYTREHSDRVARSSKQFARWLKVDEGRYEDIAFGAKLHDIGKVGTPDRILNGTGALSKEDRIVIQSHPVTGAQILEPIWLMKDIVPMVKLHHENWDGTGYPDGRKGDETPMAARIVKIADYFDAITSHRPYRTPLSLPDACAVLESERGKQLDPELTQGFIAMVTESGTNLRGDAPVPDAAEPVATR